MGIAYDVRVNMTSIEVTATASPRREGKIVVA